MLFNSIKRLSLKASYEKYFAEMFTNISSFVKDNIVGSRRKAERTRRVRNVEETYERKHFINGTL